MAGAAPASLSDLVRDTRLDVQVYTDYVIQVNLVSDPAAGRRRQRIEQRWEAAGIIGRGSFGEVRLERCTSSGLPHHVGQLRAVKIVRKAANDSLGNDPPTYHRELEAIAKFSQKRYRDYFVESYGWFETSSSIYVSMEYLPLGDLERYLTRPLPVDEARAVTYQLLEGLQIMHENQFAHRDMKPMNILVLHLGPKWWVKIADFGIAKRDASTALRTTAGTEAYVAPEVLGFHRDADANSVSAVPSPRKNQNNAYSVLVDIWSLGVIVYQMVVGKRPFDNLGKLSEYVTRNKDVLGIDSSVPDTCANFIRQTMTVDPAARPTAEEALRHDWLNGYQEGSIAEDGGASPARGFNSVSGIIGTFDGLGAEAQIQDSSTECPVVDPFSASNQRRLQKRTIFAAEGKGKETMKVTSTFLGDWIPSKPWTTAEDLTLASEGRRQEAAGKGIPSMDLLERQNSSLTTGADQAVTGHVKGAAPASPFERLCRVQEIPECIEVCFSVDGRFLASVHWEASGHRTKLWQRKNPGGTFQATHAVEARHVMGLRLMPDGHLSHYGNDRYADKRQFRSGIPGGHGIDGHVDARQVKSGYVSAHGNDQFVDRIRVWRQAKRGILKECNQIVRASSSFKAANVIAGENVDRTRIVIQVRYMSFFPPVKVTNELDIWEWHGNRNRFIPSKQKIPIPVSHPNWRSEGNEARVAVSRTGKLLAIGWADHLNAVRWVIYTDDGAGNKIRLQTLPDQFRGFIRSEYFSPTERAFVFHQRGEGGQPDQLILFLEDPGGVFEAVEVSLRGMAMEDECRIVWDRLGESFVCTGVFLRPSEHRGHRKMVVINVEKAPDGKKRWRAAGLYDEGRLGILDGEMAGSADGSLLAVRGVGASGALALRGSALGKYVGDKWAIFSAGDLERDENRDVLVMSGLGE